MRSLLLDRAGELDDLRGQAPLAGFQDPPVGIGKAGEVEVQQFRERALGVIEAGLELAGRRAEGRDGRILRRRHRPARIAQQRLARGVVDGSDAPGLEERVPLPRAQPVAQEGVGQARLLGAWERCEVVGGGRREAAGIDVRDDGRGEPTAKGEAAVDPAAPAAEQLGDLRRREPVLVGQRAQHARLVHRTERAARSVGLQQPGLAHDAGGVLDNDRHVRLAVARPVRQALEAIEHLVGAVAVRGDAHRQRGERARGIGARTAQRRERGREPLDRQIEHDAHGRRSSRGSSW
jgi:hypothetical protein